MKLRDLYRRSIITVLAFGIAFIVVGVIQQFREGKGLLSMLKGEAEAELSEIELINTSKGIDLAEVPTLAKSNEEIAKIYEAVSPSVVSITTEMVSGNISSVVEQGSGVIVTDKGHVLTSYHVIAANVSRPIRYQVELIDGTLVEAKLEGEDPALDLALLRIVSGETYQPIAMGNSDSVRVGHRVFAFGNPFRLGVSASEGNIAAKDRFLSEIQHDLFQITAPINPGQSGGPLVNIQGELIGINSAIYSKDKQFPGFQGIAFSIRGNDVKESLIAMLKKEKTVRGYVGIMLGNLTDFNRKKMEYNNASGALVHAIAPGSPAEKAGVKKGDIITRFDGKLVAERKHLLSLVKRNANKEVEISLWRSGEEESLKVSVGELGKAVDFLNSNTDEKLVTIVRKVGIIPADLTIAEKRKGLPGVRVGELVEGSLADRNGIQEGDFVISLNGMRITNGQWFLSMLRSTAMKQSNELRIYRENVGQKAVKFPMIEVE